MPVDGMRQTAHTDSVGEVMLRLASTEEKFRLDSETSATFRTALVPEDVLNILRTPNLKLHAAQNPSALLMGMAKDQVHRARSGKLFTLVPMLMRIDEMRDQWRLDEEAEGLLKFAIPSTQVLEWLDQTVGAMREARKERDACAFIKSRLRRMILDLRAAEAGRGPAALTGRREDEDRSHGRHRSRSRSRGRRDGINGPPARREADRPPAGSHGQWPLPRAVSEEQPRHHAPPSLRVVPPPVAPMSSASGKLVGGSGKGSGKGNNKGAPRQVGPVGDAGDAAQLMAQIQKLQSQLETAKHGF